MNFRGGHGGLGNRKRALIDGAAVDLTPLIDVTFQLLIFFLLTATFNNDAAFKVKLPKATANDPATETKAIVVEISEDGRFEVNKKVVDQAELETRLCMAAKELGATTVNIKADQNTKHEKVVQAMDVAKACGIEKLGILHRR
ncbi:biopolymer transporter ExbD [Nannocystis sp.]|uniref:ExbD/TolR family protein n=1 Tax=Nannocystis sp. TaxID=1962667 RepID=UPI002422BFCC|nr:biopolymer transporter ExbD [Nannocystis sp.]MBK7830097.1 biopolymer transporter ExbD [Nannocystis sp.]MBK9752076.1 biopolymer transporter ExbD [Nannocystis sp.]